MRVEQSRKKIRDNRGLDAKKVRFVGENLMKFIVMVSGKLGLIAGALLFHCRI